MSRNIGVPKMSKKRPSTVNITFREEPGLKKMGLDDKVTLLIECSITSMHDTDEWSEGSAQLEIEKCKLMNKDNAASMSLDKLKEKIEKKD